MALKGDRSIYKDTIEFSCLAITNRGVVLCHSGVGSGTALGATAGTVDLMANPSGKAPAGVLLQDMVLIDQSRYSLNFQKEQVPSGAPVWMAKYATLTTDQLVAGQTPTAGGTAYLSTFGQVTATVSSTGGIVATPKVGQFLGSVDANGFVKVDFIIPVV